MFDNYLTVFPRSVLYIDLRYDKFVFQEFAKNVFGILQSLKAREEGGSKKVKGRPEEVASTPAVCSVKCLLSTTISQGYRDCLFNLLLNDIQTQRQQALGYNRYDQERYSRYDQERFGGKEGITLFCNNFYFKSNKMSCVRAYVILFCNCMHIHPYFCEFPEFPEYQTKSCLFFSRN